jgi:glycosyltransferase involved in cell wall biosynthesis
MRLHVFYFTDSSAFGGSEQVLLTLLRGLDRTHWEPVLIHHPEPGLAPLLQAARDMGVETRVVPRMRGKQGATLVPRFVQQLRQARPAVFHANLTMPLDCKYGLAAAALARVPAILATEHLFVGIPWQSSRMIERLAAKGVDRYIAVSQQISRELAQALPFLASKLQVIHNGIDLEAFGRTHDARSRRMCAATARRPIVLTVARLTAQKGITYLLRAAAQAPEALFVVVGEGPERAALEAQAGDLDLHDRVLFLGPRADIPDLLANCDLFVLPSLFEGLSLSILEALAAGKPVIATDVGGTSEVITHCETGLLVAPADPGALANAIHTLLSDAPLARRLAAAGQARVQRDFSAERMVQSVTNLYRELLQARGIN